MPAAVGRVKRGHQGNRKGVPQCIRRPRRNSEPQSPPPKKVNTVLLICGQVVKESNSSARALADRALRRHLPPPPPKRNVRMWPTYESHDTSRSTRHPAPPQHKVVKGLQMRAEFWRCHPPPPIQAFPHGVMAGVLSPGPHQLKTHPPTHPSRVPRHSERASTGVGGTAPLPEAQGDWAMQFRCVGKSLSNSAFIPRS